MIIHRVTAVAHQDQTEELVELMKTEARALFQISRICTIINPEEGEHNVVVFDIDFDDTAGLNAWRENIGTPDNKAFFEKWGSMVETYSAQDFVTAG
jgi:antibiotic biosynthesis monooxygenase (ABM) superfamily enzyme